MKSGSICLLTLPQLLQPNHFGLVHLVKGHELLPDVAVLMHLFLPLKTSDPLQFDSVGRSQTIPLHLLNWMLAIQYFDEL